MLQEAATPSVRRLFKQPQNQRMRSFCELFNWSSLQHGIDVVMVILNQTARTVTVVSAMAPSSERLYTALLHSQRSLGS